jgi:hypothetical protein
MRERRKSHKESSHEVSSSNLHSNFFKKEEGGIMGRKYLNYKRGE